jgi:hypothetical protein
MMLPRNQIRRKFQSATFLSGFLCCWLTDSTTELIFGATSLEMNNHHDMIREQMLTEVEYRV